MKEPILSREEVKALYSKHFVNPYDLLPLWAEAFSAALESAILEKLCGEPVAWLVDIEDEPQLGHWFAEQPDSIHRCRPLYALSRSKA